MKDKGPTLKRLAWILADAEVAYAVIDGVALQVHRSEPRTTLDIDIAMLCRSDVPE